MKKTIISIFLLSFCLSHSYLLADAIWTGTGCDLNNNANWQGGTQPDATTLADFGTSSCYTPTISTLPTVSALGFVFSGTNNYTFNITNNGLLHIGASGIAPLTLPVNVEFDLTVFDGELTFTGCSLNTILINNSSTGGILSLTSVSGDNATVNLSSGAELQVGPGGNSSIGNLTSASLSDQITFFNNQLTVGNLNLPATIAGALSGTGLLVKTGTGVLTLSGNNSAAYTGGISINQGTLSVSSASNLPNGGTITFGGAATILDTQTGVFTIANPVQLTATGTINVGSGGTTTMSGKISGLGSLLKRGDGILALTNVTNDYAGDTSIHQGTLQVSVASAIPNIGIINFLGTGTEVLDTLTGVAIPNLVFTNINGTINVNSGTTTLSDNVQGPGSITKTGAGTLIFSFVGNDYLGGTTIKGGTVRVSASSNLPTSGTITFSAPGPNTLDTQNGGILIPNPIVLSSNGTVNVSANATTLSGAIGGGGGLAVIGGGRLILSGVNNYSGGTTISGVSTLEGTTSSLQGAITNNGGLVFNQSTSGTYSGNISGAGFFEKFGSGTVTLTGTNSAGIGIIFNGGLKVNGALNASASFATQAGTTLSGIGTLTSGTILISGNLQPGNSIGTINMVGPVTLGSTSNYQVEFDASSCDRLNVTGSVAIDPGASVTLLEDQLIFLPASYTIISATSVAGTFTTFNNPYSLFLNASLSYNLGTVILNLGRNSFTSILLGANAPFNAIAVAGDLDTINPLGGSDLDNVVANLLTATSADVLIHDLLQIQPSQIKALGVSETNTTVQLHSIISEHAGSYTKTACTVENRKKWSVWGDLFGVFSHQGVLHGELGFHDKTGGGLIGIDALPCKNLSVGGALSYTFTHLNWNHNPSHATIQNGYGIFYASWFNRHFFVTSVATCGYNHNDVDRNIFLFTSPINTTAHSSFSGVEGSGFMEMGATANYQKAEFKPFISLHYCYLHHNHFKERGADGLNLRIDGANANLLRSEGGLQISYCYRREDVEWIPRVAASVVEENRFKGKYYRTEFVENPGVFFTVKGLRPQHTLFSPKASIQMKKGENFSLFLGYEGEFGSKFHNNRAHMFINRSF